MKKVIESNRSIAFCTKRVRGWAEVKCKQTITWPLSFFIQITHKQMFYNLILNRPKWELFSYNWRPSNLSELTPIIFNIELTNLSSEASNSYRFMLKNRSIGADNNNGFCYYLITLYMKYITIVWRLIWRMNKIKKTYSNEQINS